MVSKYIGFEIQIINLQSIFIINKVRMFYSNGYSRPIRYESYNPRAAKFDVLRFGDQEKSQSQEIIVLLSLYKKRYTDKGGLQAGIQFDDKTVGLRLVSPRTGITVQTFINQYYIHCQGPSLTRDVSAGANDEKDEKFYNFGDFKDRVQTIIGKLQESEADMVIAVLNKHGNEYEDLGGLQKGIKFSKKNVKGGDKRNSVNRKSKQISSSGRLEFKNEYYIIFWSPIPSSMLSADKENYVPFDNFDDCLKALDQKIADIAS